MPTLKNRYLANVLSTLTALVLFFSACTPGPAAPVKVTPTPTARIVISTVTPATPAETLVATASPIPLPEISLNPGDHYFSVDGRQHFLFTRNLAGYETWHYDRLLDMAKTGNTILVRIQLDSMGTGITREGNVDEIWAKNWEHVFDKAEENGIHVLPVFSGWFDWNNGEPDYGYSTWDQNAFNTVNGGPAASPAELFQPDSVTQRMWFDWMRSLVERWHARENIAAWEIFSEVNIATGTTESSGVAFIEQAAAIIRNADPRHHPITASLADVGEWTHFYQSEAIDFLNIHPYPYDARLDLGTKVIKDVRYLLSKYNKPVIIGESGLNTFLPDSESGSGVLPNAELGFSHAIWSEMVSGAMNGRSLYWEDSFAIFFPSLSWDYLQSYASLEQPAADFAKNVDFADFKPLEASFSAKISGAALGNEKMVIGWFRDTGCEPPEWPLQTVISGQTVTVSVSGSAGAWKVDFYSTETGTKLIASTTATQVGNQVTFSLPDFTDDIAFKMYPQPGSGIAESVDTPQENPIVTTDPMAGKWAGTITGKNSSFSTTVEISIEQNCESGNVCGTITAPLLSCSGELFLEQIRDQTYVFVEQGMTGAALCESGTYEYVHLEANGTLSLNTVYTSPSGEESESSGTLIKQ